MNFLYADFVNGFIRLANDGWEHNWNERHGGNLSYRVKAREVEDVKEELQPGEWEPLLLSVPELAEEFFLVTCEDISFRDIMDAPRETICMIELDKEGRRYRKVWGAETGIEPTLSLPIHLLCHRERKSIGKNARVVYHAHPSNLITLTYYLPLKSDKFTQELVKISAECEKVIPNGVAIIPWKVTGKENSSLTTEYIREHDVVIWAHHGVIITGDDFSLVFGAMHALEKAAEILVKLLILETGKKVEIKTEEER